MGFTLKYSQDLAASYHAHGHYPGSTLSSVTWTRAVAWSRASALTHSSVGRPCWGHQRAPVGTRVRSPPLPLSLSSQRAQVSTCSRSPLCPQPCRLPPPWGMSPSPPCGPPVPTPAARPLLPLFPSLILLQTHWSPHRSSNTPGVVLPQDLCAACALCLGCCFPIDIPTVPSLTIFKSLLKCHFSLLLFQSTIFKIYVLP